MASCDFQDNFFNCPICTERFKEPKILQCLHSFCKVCLKTYITSHVTRQGKRTGFLCPVCRQFQESSDPKRSFEEWADSLPTNFNLVCMIENWPSEEVHNQRCFVHGKPIEFTCKDHNEDICSNCAIFDHKSCEVTDIDRNGPNLDQRIDEFYQKINTAIEVKKKTEAYIERLNEDKTNFRSKIVDENQAMRRKLVQLEKKLLDDLDILHRKQMQFAEDKIAKLDSVITSSHRVIDTVLSSDSRSSEEIHEAGKTMNELDELINDSNMEGRNMSLLMNTNLKRAIEQTREMGQINANQEMPRRSSSSNLRRQRSNNGRIPPVTVRTGNKTPSSANGGSLDVEKPPLYSEAVYPIPPPTSPAVETGIIHSPAEQDRQHPSYPVSSASPKTVPQVSTFLTEQEHQHPSYPVTLTSPTVVTRISPSFAEQEHQHPSYPASFSTSPKSVPLVSPSLEVQESQQPRSPLVRSQSHENPVQDTRRSPSAPPLITPPYKKEPPPFPVRNSGDDSSSNQRGSMSPTQNDLHSPSLTDGASSPRQDEYDGDDYGGLQEQITRTPYTTRYIGSLDLKTSTDRHHCYVSGACFLSSGDILIADRKNKKLKIFSSSYDLVAERLLRDKPFDVLQTHEGHIAVSVTKLSQVQFFDTSLLTEFPAILTENPCRGVSEADKHLYVFCTDNSSSEGCIKVYNEQHTMLYIVAKDESGRILFWNTEYISVCPNSKSIYFNRGYLGKSTIVCIDLFGHMKWKSKTPSWGDTPHGMVAIDKGLVVAAGSIKCISENGNKWKKIIEIPESAKTHTVALNQERTIMLVTYADSISNASENNHARIFLLRY